MHQTLRKSLLGLVLLSTVFASGASVSFFHEKHAEPLTVEAAVGTYYDGINDSLTETSLLSALRSLNSTKRTRTVGYDNMDDYYEETDGDPSNQNNLIAFYSGTSAYFNGSFSSGNFNREHVWPNSRGGSVVEGDIHMTRPTLVAENSSRGNSFYVEGMTSSTSGWDPGAESWGLDKYRGIAARIVFYAVVASSTLSLVDTTNDATSNKTMGKLSTLLDWNLRYGIDATENQRNEAAQGIQGNRNPFIDHPEYACKIWGSYNANTQSVCSASQISPTSISLTPSSASISKGGTRQLSVNVTPSNADASVTWSSSNTNVATVSNGLVTAVAEGSATITATSTVDTAIKGTCAVTVTPQVAPTSLTMNKSTATISVGNTTTLGVTASPAGANNSVIWSSSNTGVALVNNGVVSGISEGSATITATSTVAPSVSATSTITVNQVSEETTTYTFTSNNWNATSGGSSANWYSGMAGNLFLNNGVQVSTGVSGAYANSPTTFSDLQSVTITYCTNSSSGAGTINLFAVTTATAAAQSGTRIGTSQSVTTSGGTASRTLTYTPSGIGNDVYIQIYVATTTNSIYIQQATIVSGAESSADPQEEATTWASAFLTQTNNGCSLQSYNILSNAWTGVSSSYSSMSEAAQMIVELAAPNAEGTTVEHAKARYLIIIDKYPLDDFILNSGSSSSPAMVYVPVATSAFLIFAFSAFALSSLAALICLQCRKRKAD
ncbi:MAG: Ig-like domain-containing protein [Bacilli bacterium]|jgi:uncharacterized protein YjdB